MKSSIASPGQLHLRTGGNENDNPTLEVPAKDIFYSYWSRAPWLRGYMELTAKFLFPQKGIEILL